MRRGSDLSGGGRCMILCCGEALIDMIPAGSAGEGGRLLRPTPGGAVFNTARALGRLGVRAGYFGGLSADFLGRMLRGALAESAVDTALAPIFERPTTLSFVRMEDGQARYAFYDENTAGRMLSPADLPELSAEVHALFFGGISLVAEPCGSAFEALLAREAGRRLIVLDPNIRPGFITDETAYRARLARMIARADILKLSDEDLAWLAGSDDPAAARAFLEAGPALVVLTRGGAQALAFTKAGEGRAFPPEVEIADTIGAGDTFNAGLLAALEGQGALAGRAGLEGLGAEGSSRALHFACRAAALSVTREGADPPWAHELAG